MTRIEKLRYMVRRHLAERASAAQDAETIHFFVSKLEACDVGEVDTALSFLAGLGQVVSEYGGLGSTKYWQVTSAGVLAHERGE